MANYNQLLQHGEWWHVEGGLNWTKKRLGEFCYHALGVGGDIGQLWLFSKHARSMVVASVQLTPEMKAELMEACPWLVLRVPPRVHIN